MEEGRSWWQISRKQWPVSRRQGDNVSGRAERTVPDELERPTAPGVISDEQTMHCDIFATLLDAATIPVPKMNGKNPIRGMSLMPHMLSAGKETTPKRTMIFELWGNIGLRKGDYKLWSQIGREHSPDWDALVAELQLTDLALFDLSKDVAEKNDLRTKLPEVYASLKKELIDHLSNINAEYPGGGSSAVDQEEKSKPRKTTTTRAPKGRSQGQFFKNRDRNGDGSITLEEYIGNPKGRNVPALTTRFKKFDSNGDGKLQLDELKN